MEGIELENSQSNFVRMIKEICEEEGISCISYSSDWAFQVGGQAVLGRQAL